MPPVSLILVANLPPVSCIQAAILPQLSLIPVVHLDTVPLKRQYCGTILFLSPFPLLDSKDQHCISTKIVGTIYFPLTRKNSFVLHKRFYSAFYPDTLKEANSLPHLVVY